MVVKSKGNPLISGKSGLVKYDNLTRKLHQSSLCTVEISLHQHDHFMANRIHGTGIFAWIWLIFMVNVSK